MRVLITDFDFPDVDLERAIYAEAGIECVTAQCRTEQDVIDAASGCAGLLSSTLPSTPGCSQRGPRFVW
jgi:D-3-phosphoglycerate dehydrogenase